MEMWVGSEWITFPLLRLTTCTLAKKARIRIEATGSSAINIAFLANFIDPLTGEFGAEQKGVTCHGF